MDLIVFPDGERWSARFGSRTWPCVVGRGGATADKREGDGATPLGCWPMRRLLYRPDRNPRVPETRLPVQAIGPGDGWCDAPDDSSYNRPVALPYSASHERLWRDDGIYDLLVVLGHNDDPPVASAGSAIFLHLARPDWEPTAGCVALTRPALLEVLGAAGPESRVCIRARQE